MAIYQWDLCIAAAVMVWQILALKSRKQRIRKMPCLVTGAVLLISALLYGIYIITQSSSVMLALCSFLTLMLALICGAGLGMVWLVYGIIYWMRKL